MEIILLYIVNLIRVQSYEDSEDPTAGAAAPSIFINQTNQRAASNAQPSFVPSL